MECDRKRRDNNNYIIIIKYFMPRRHRPYILSDWNVKYIIHINIFIDDFSDNIIHIHTTPRVKL